MLAYLRTREASAAWRFRSDLGCYLAFIALCSWLCAWAVGQTFSAFTTDPRLVSLLITASPVGLPPWAHGKVGHWREEPLSDVNSHLNTSQMSQMAMASIKPETPPLPVGLTFNVYNDEGYSGDAVAPARSGRRSTYRTVCVRLCDGSYFPVSFATTPEKFHKDEEKCQGGCTSPAKLFVYQSSGQSAEAMEDLEGRPYSKLATAFKFRTSHDASCNCRSSPWEQAAKDQHRVYDLENRLKNGDQTAASELNTLKAEVEAKKAANIAAAAMRVATASLDINGKEISTRTPRWRKNRSSRSF